MGSSNKGAEAGHVSWIGSCSIDSRMVVLLAGKPEGCGASKTIPKIPRHPVRESDQLGPGSMLQWD